MDIIYDVAHNVAKIETHEVDGEEKELLVQRKGSTRCFGPGRKEIPEMAGISRKVVGLRPIGNIKG